MLSPVFNIKNIIVEGNSKITSEQIISLSKIQKDENMFKVSDKEVKSKIVTVNTSPTIERIIDIKQNDLVNEKTIIYPLTFKFSKNNK